MVTGKRMLSPVTDSMRILRASGGGGGGGGVVQRAALSSP